MAAALTWLQCAHHVLSLHKAPLSAQEILDRIIQLNIRDTKGQAPYNTLETALKLEAKKPGGCIMKDGARYKLREKAHGPTTVTNRSVKLKSFTDDQSPTKRSRHSNDLGSDDGDSEPESDGGSEMMDITTPIPPVPSGTLSPSSRVAASLDQMRLNDHDSDDDGEIEHLLKSKSNNGLHLNANGSLTTIKAASASVTSRPHSNNQTTTSKPVTITSTARSSKQQNAQLAASSRGNHNRVRSLATSSTPADGLTSSPALIPTNSGPKTGFNGLSRKISSGSSRVASTAKQSYVGQGGTTTAITSSAPPKLNPSVSPSPKSHSRKRPPSPTKPTTAAITTSSAPSKLTPSISPQKPRPVVNTASRNRPPSPPVKSRGSSDRLETEGDHTIETEDEDENFRPTPSTLKEKRARAVRRAEQLKKWRVREDREARELRAVARRKYVAGDGNGRTAVQESRESGSVSSGDEKERDRTKSVKFNLRRNMVFEFDGEPDGDADGGAGNRGGKIIGIVEGVDGVVELGPTAMVVI